MERQPVADNFPKRFLFGGMSDKRKSLIVEVIALLFEILFLYTGVAKLMDYYTFESQLAESPVLEPVAPIIAIGLPITEIIVAIILFIPKWRLLGLNISAVLMVTFTLYIAIILMFSTELPCSCGGVLEELSWPAHLIMNVVLIGLAWIGIKLQSSMINNQ